jgi:hypothetical protein
MDETDYRSHDNDMRERASERQRGAAVNRAASASEGSSPSAPTDERKTGGSPHDEPSAPDWTGTGLLSRPEGVQVSLTAPDFPYCFDEIPDR